MPTPEQVEILRTLRRENPKIALPRRPKEQPQFGQSCAVAIMQGLWLSGMIGVDEDGNLAITEDGISELDAN